MEELKIDGWRAIAVVEGRACRLICRGFIDVTAELAKRLPDGTVLDGEICRLNDSGRRGSTNCHFYAFDALRIADEDLRSMPLIERKARLQKLIRRGPSRLFLSRVKRTADIFHL